MIPLGQSPAVILTSSARTGLKVEFFPRTLTDISDVKVTVFTIVTHTPRGFVIRTTISHHRRMRQQRGCRSG